jgi:hypothetical protein
MLMMEPPPALDMGPISARDHRLNVIRVAHVRGMRQCGTSIAGNGTGSALCSFFVQIHNEYGGAAGGESLRAGFADSCSGYDRRTPIEFIFRHLTSL